MGLLVLNKDSNKKHRWKDTAQITRDVWPNQFAVSF